MTTMTAGERVHVRDEVVPDDYHCSCQYCQSAIGELRQADGGYYSRLERRKYYDRSEHGTGGHIAKTPLHIARWAIQQYTQPGDWVLDPTIGAGTTAVEALTQGRSVAGMELEYGEIVQANVKKIRENFPNGAKAVIGIGDARNIGPFLNEIGERFQLVVNNPPYSGDISMPSPKGKLRGKEHRHLETRFDYDKELPNIAFLKEGAEYWETMGTIYKQCIERLVPGGHFVIGIKDMMRDKKPFKLHELFCDMLVGLGLQYVGAAFLKHHPGTLFLNTYEKIHGAVPPKYQTINVFKKA